MTFPKPEDARIIDVVERAIEWHPRSQQEHLGPSGLGDPCDRSLTYALAGVRPARAPYSGWKPTIGTAAHAWAEAAFLRENERLGYTRWLTERRVFVGMIGTEPLTGQMDLFDLFEAEALDWKFVGPSMLKKYRSGGPSTVYRVQAQAYGRGMEILGHRPRTVAIAFMPRDGELSSAFVWREPYDPQVTVDALDRANRLYDGLYGYHGGDPRAAASDFDECSESWCDWCRDGRRFIPGGGSMFDVLKGNAS